MAPVRLFSIVNSTPNHLTNPIKTMKRTSFLFLLCAGLMCFAESAAHAAVFIKIGDIKGESTDAEHPEWSELSSMKFSIARDLEAGSTRLRPPVAAAFDFIKRIDKSSPLLVEAMTKELRQPKYMIAALAIRHLYAQRDRWLDDQIE